MSLTILKNKLRPIIISIIEEYFENKEKKELISFEDFCTEHGFKLSVNQFKGYKFIDEYNFTIINKYRQLGMSTLLKLYSGYKCVSKPKTKILYLGYDFEFSPIFENKISFRTMTDIVFKNGSIIELKKINTKIERDLIAKGFDLVVFDELYNNPIDYQTVADHLKPEGKIIVTSSPHKDSPFNKLAVKAYKGMSGFKYLKLNWFEDDKFNKNLTIDINGEYQSDYTKEKRKTYIHEMFEEEILGKIYVTEE